ncbi:Coiled-coil domain-containing protein 96 [Dufourea novaeangliae]|uniref:Coiled-coil domain-containing protein 96 n=1 Tax=Dufourea novaeangliae TaxID=178035 RepID=A0A154NZ89_DUFNO|nr:Coiled-coil domain-containing protein 96 [Dufourea novaeangliae]
MDDNVQNGLEQWLPVFDKGEKRANSLGSGALRFIRTRSSIRRELKRQCNRSKNGDSSMVHEVPNGGSGGGGLGKWLRDHLGGGSKNGQDTSSPLKSNGSLVEGSGGEKPLARTVHASQNLYCSLPREHGRHSYNGARKTGHGNSLKPQGHDRQRSNSVNHHEKTTLSDLGTLTRGGPIYGSEGKSLKKRNRDRRRHSLNETHDQGRQRRRSTGDRVPASWNKAHRDEIIACAPQDTHCASATRRCPVARSGLIDVLRERRNSFPRRDRLSTMGSVKQPRLVRGREVCTANERANERREDHLRSSRSTACGLRGLHEEASIRAASNSFDCFLRPAAVSLVSAFSPHSNATFPALGDGLESRSPILSIVPLAVSDMTTRDELREDAGGYADEKIIEYNDHKSFVDPIHGYDSYEIEEHEDEEEEEQEESGRVKKSIDEEIDWYVSSDQSIVGGKYGEEFYEGEELGEEEIPLSPEDSVEKLEEARQVEESDHVLVELPAEDAAEREALISRLTELQTEYGDLRRRNRLLDLWVSRCMTKNQQRMTPPDPTKNTEQMEKIYKEVLRVYKMQVDDILTQQNELTYEMQTYTEKIDAIRAENEAAFNEFLDREREVAVGLVFEKTGKKLTDKMMNALTHRQTMRSKILAQDRQGYILLRHCLEDLKTRLKGVETLGEGMTTVDYEALHVANLSYKDKLDERDQELEKLRAKIAKTVNGVAQYKEKEVCLIEDIEYEEESLKNYREKNTRNRECVNKARVRLNELRIEFNEKRIEAGLLVAQPALLDMERRMYMRNDLREAIEALEHEIKQYEPERPGKRARSSVQSEDRHWSKSSNTTF